METTTIPAIKKIEYWSPNAVQDFCIKCNMYTCGTNREYSEMFDFIRTHEPTTKNLYIVADNILKHSNDEVNNNFIVTDIMMLLEKNTVLIDYFIED